jgi:RecA/RadA recombinase
VVDINKAFNMFTDEKLGIKSSTSDLSSDIAQVYSLGAPIDCVLGGGVASGKIYEISGYESHGKSTLAVEFAKSFQKYWKGLSKKCVILWIEAESVFDKLRYASIGLDLSSEYSSVFVQEALTLESGFDAIKSVCEKSISSGIPAFVVWDTIAASPTANELEKGAFGGGMTEKPRVIRAKFREIGPLLAQGGITLVLVNQVYQGMGQFATIETPGGGGIKFHASCRIRIKKQEVIVDATSGVEKTIAIVCQLSTLKNKLVNPGLIVPVYISGEYGIDQVETLIRYFKQTKIIEGGSAGWMKLAFKEKGYKFQNGRKLKDYIVEEPDLLTYMCYLSYKSFSDFSSLVRVRYIKILNEFEDQLKITRTVLSERETELAKAIYEHIQDVNLDA